MGGGPAEKYFYPEIQQKNTAHQPQRFLFARKKSGNGGQSKTRHGTVGRICGGGAQAGNKTRGTALRQGAPNAENANRPHRGGDAKTDQQAAQEKVHFKGKPACSR